MNEIDILKSLENSKLRTDEFKLDLIIWTNQEVLKEIWKLRNQIIELKKELSELKSVKGND